MVRLRDFAGRFRPAGVPGAAAPAGVPADRATGPTAELEPVFAALTGVHARCAGIRALAEADARDTLAAADDRAAAVLATARSRADAERAQAAAVTRDRMSAESRTATETARRQAEALRARAASLVPGEVERVVARVRSLATDPGATQPTANPDAVGTAVTTAVDPDAGKRANGP
ncbi:hypothetical protein ACFFMN_39140 [Planobispora siamensis]|uniref:Uncharacterized protein n=1 Tax=Planobispora siamensis TaxID=936338 RepID=A0A8J3SL94_9ACTN|nr:hypothetical protein [Planobispora siamensis]GIH96322.1 hypothetical protein Psi01_69520 [Planobispora siamensis]